jgi:hypothetical protein
MHALNNSGLIFRQVYATRVPPAEDPLAASILGWVSLFAISHSAHDARSSNELYFLSSLPSSCHEIPQSPPPLTIAYAITQPRSIAAKLTTLKL